MGVGAQKLHGRLVDTDLELRVNAVAPLQHLCCCLLEYPLAYFHDQPAAFRHRNKVCRADQATRRMQPSDERLRLVDLARLHVHDGLVGNPKLLLLQCVAQVLCQSNTLLGGFLQGWGVKTEAVTTCILGGIQCLVSVFEQIFYTFGVQWIDGDANTG